MRRYLPVLLALPVLMTVPQAAGAKPLSAPMQRAMAIGQFAAQQAAQAAEAACMSGTPMPPSEIEEARTPAIAAMRGYWSAAMQGGTVAPFFVSSAKARWRSGDDERAPGAFAALHDPLAVEGSRLDETPIWFVRAGDATSALGVWNAVDASGQRKGAYRALLRREGSVWKLFDLTLVGADKWHRPALQYCHAPDDVQKARLSLAKGQLAHAMDAEARSVRKAAQVEVRLRRAHEAFLRAPDNAGRQRNYDRLLGEAREARLETNTRQRLVIRARQDLAQARSQMQLAGLSPD